MSSNMRVDPLVSLGIILCIGAIILVFEYREELKLKQIYEWIKKRREED